jgi:hypothetical protein
MASIAIGQRQQSPYDIRLIVLTLGRNGYLCTRAEEHKSGSTCSEYALVAFDRSHGALKVNEDGAE